MHTDKHTLHMQTISRLAYSDVRRCFCQSDNTIHAINEPQASELGQHHRQNGVEVVGQHVMPYTLTCAKDKQSLSHCELVTLRDAPTSENNHICMKGNGGNDVRP